MNSQTLKEKVSSKQFIKEQMKPQTLKAKVPSIQFEEVINTYDLLVFHKESGADLKIADEFNELVINKGDVWLDGEKIHQPEFGPNSVSWSQQTSDSFCSGVLDFSTDCMAFRGSIHKGKTASVATLLNITGTASPTIYETKITSGSSEQSGLKFKLGYKPSITGGFPVSIRELGFEDNYQDIAPFTSMKVDPKNNQLIISMDYNPDIADAGFRIFGEIWPAKFSLELSWDGRTFSGNMNQYDPQMKKPKKESCPWNGTADIHSKLIWEEAVRLLAEVVPQKLSTAAPEYSVGDLMTISPEGVRELANSMLIENMKYEMPDKWRSELMGSEKPILSPRRIAQLRNQTAVDFYSKKLSPAYLTWGLANTDSPAIKVKLDDKQKRKLKYYLHNGLAREKGYNAQSNALFIEAFIESSPKLQNYINDKNTDWGQKLYDTLTTDEQINQVVSIIIATQSMQVANRYSTLLSCFPNKSDLAIQYNKMLVSALMMTISSNYEANDKDQIMEWLPDFIEQFVLAYEHQPANPDVQAEMARWEQAKALKEAAEVVGGFVELAQAMADCIIAAESLSSFAKSNKAVQEFVEKHPKLSSNISAVASFIRVAILAGGIYTVVQGFMNWKKLDTQGKVGLIISTVELMGNLILAIPDFIKITGLSISGIGKVTRWFSATRVGELLNTGLTRLAQCLPDVPDWLVRIGNQIGKFFNAVKKIIEDPPKFLSKLFKGFSTFMKFFGVAVAAAFAVLSTITFVKDLIAGSSVVDAVFDGLIAVAGIMETICLALALVPVLEVFAIAAAFFAVIGLIFVIVQMFIPKPKPDSPMDKFLKETGIPFIAELEEPPGDWNENRSGQVAKLMAAY